MADELERQIAALQRDTRNRQVLVVAVVVGIFAGIAGGLVIPPMIPGIPWSLRAGLLACMVAPFAVCMGLGYAIYGALRWWSERRA